jgi:carbon monoxide dehydrogenase subunit G
MAPITVSEDIDRPADDVFAYATDPSRFAEWQNGVVSGHMDQADSPSIGDRCVMVRRIGFTDRTSTAELVHVDPPRTWRVHGIDGLIRATVDVTVTALGPDRCQVTISVDFDGHGIGALLVPLFIRRQARAEMPGNMAKLKARLESMR